MKLSIHFEEILVNKHPLRLLLEINCDQFHAMILKPSKRLQSKAN